MKNLGSESNETLRAALLTVDGKGKSFKEAALEELLARARQSVTNLDYELMQDLKRP